MRSTRNEREATSPHRRTLTLVLLGVGSLAALAIWLNRTIANEDHISHVLSTHGSTCLTDRPSPLVTAVAATGVALAAAAAVLAVVWRHGAVLMLVLALALAGLHAGAFTLSYAGDGSETSRGTLSATYCSAG